MVKISKKSGEEKIVYPSGAIEIVDQRFIKTIISPEGNKVILKIWQCVWAFSNLKYLNFSKIIYKNKYYIVI